uniref:Uncharacterized protein TCIL3000_8_160 n=1 Tax=Trypanosoma congolense (strain IL3000) TaxID=1068625 RepID=G0UR05_TRYCI|nr:unnamed protein product [Trypanosoma congolense IL3000]
MDFWTVLRQRQQESNAEVRRVLRVSLAYSLVAVVVLFVSATAAPYRHKPGAGDERGPSRVLVAIFSLGSVVGYLFLVHSINVLCRNRFFLPISHTMTGNAMAACLLPCKNDRISGRWRSLLVYCHPLLSLFSIGCGFMPQHHNAYVLLLAVQLISFTATWIFYARAVNSSR